LRFGKRSNDIQLLNDNWLNYLFSDYDIEQASNISIAQGISHTPPDLHQDLFEITPFERDHRQTLKNLKFLIEPEIFCNSPYKDKILQIGVCFILSSLDSSFKTT
jgi:hypothetical protein